MKTRNKALLLIACAVMLVAASVLGTMAYLTSTDSATNTFTVGDVNIKLDEAPVDNAGQKTTGDRVKANSYQLFPGGTYDKDPMVTVLADSESSYIRMKVKVSDMTELKKAFTSTKYPAWYDGDLFLLQKLCTGWDGATWACKGYTAGTGEDKSGTYEFRYKETVGSGSGFTDTALDPLFTNVVIPGTVTNAELASLGGLTIDITAEAIQADGFDDADAAWTAFDAK